MVNFISSDGAPTDPTEGDGHETVPVIEGPYEGGFFTGAHSPFPLKPGPELIDAVDFTPSAYSPERLGGRGYISHRIRHEQNAIFIDGVNIRDIIATLQSQVADLIAAAGP